MADAVSSPGADRPPAGEPVAVVVAPHLGVAAVWRGGSMTVATADPVPILEAVAANRLVWWSARGYAEPLVAAGLRVGACWDLGAVGAALHGLRRDDPAAVWAAAHDLPEPAPPRPTLDLFDVDPVGNDAVRADGQLSAEWVAGRWAQDLAGAARWASLALDLHRIQLARLRALEDPRPAPAGTPVRVLVAHAESAAALLCLELGHHGLPMDVAVASDLLRAAIGERPADDAAADSIRRSRDAEVLRHFPPDVACDLRSPEQVRATLARIGFDLPDTRSWRLEPHAATSAAVAALLAWRKADRLATTYGWRWLDTHVGGGGRLRGQWGVADGGSGRMTASAGLHNMPAELRPAVRAEPGHVLVRADLGQVEPRVLAAVSGDAALIDAAREPDMYSPVAARLGCDRSTAKVAVLAAMYGQTSGTAGAALRGMDRAYPAAMAYLRAAEAAGRQRREIRTYGGRLLRFGRPVDEPEPDAAVAARGRYARNAVVQGAAAELFKAWAATVRHGLRHVGGEIVMCLHDELVLHVPESAAPDAQQLLADSLAATVRWWVAGSAVHFVAEITSSASWAETHASPGSVLL